MKNSFRGIRSSQERSRGSILIASLWTLSVFTVLVSSVGFQASQQAMLLKREQNDFESRADFVSALNLLGKKILEDRDPEEDSRQDAWYGEVSLEEPWKGRVSLNVTDEESRFDINKVPQVLLENLFKILQEHGTVLQGDAQDFSDEILKLRGQGEILSLEELYLSEKIERADVEALRPYLTVYTRIPGININTADDLVLEVFIRSLAGDDFARQELLRVLLAYRHGGENQTGPGVFSPAEMTPELFMQKMGLSSTVQNNQLVLQFLAAAVTDSHVWNVSLRSAGGREAFCVMRERGANQKFEIVNWREI